MQYTAPWLQLAHFYSELPELSDIEWAALAYEYEYALRPDQMPPDTDWRWCGLIAGRGFGKSFALARWINRAVERGEHRKIALMAQNEDKTLDLQVKELIAQAPPWFKPELFAGKLVWPNGASADILTPQAPEAIRGGNYDLAWLSEIVAWPPAQRRYAFNMVTTATREGRGRVIWDTTSRGRNETIAFLLENNAKEPDKYPIIRGTMFDNPLYGKDYLRLETSKYVKGSRQYLEEVEGQVFLEAAGAVFEQGWIDASRVEQEPANLELVILASDPATTTREGSDETGLILAGRTHDGHVYTLKDWTRKVSPEDHGQQHWDAYSRHGAAGAVVETNRGGDYITALLRATFDKHGVQVKVLPPDAPFPRRCEGMYFVRQIFARGAKNSAERAGGPSTLYAQGKAHICGWLPELENEMVTYAPDASSQSPNRYDAHNMAVIELSGIASARPTPAQQEAANAGAAEANGLLRSRLRALGASRSVT